MTPEKSKRIKQELADTQERAVQNREELERLKEQNDEITRELKAKDVIFNSRRG